MQDEISRYITNPVEFQELEPEQQLALLADIVLYCTEAEIQVLEQGYKERSVEFRRAHARTTYWKDIQMNIKKLTELETAKLMRGV